MEAAWDWDYENDLELLKQKLRTCSPSIKHDIRKMVTKTLGNLVDVEPARASVSTNSRTLMSSERNVNFDTDTQGLLELNSCLDLDQSKIMNLIWMMYEFKKDFKDTTKLTKAKAIKNNVVWNLMQTTTRDKLENLWQEFKNYLQKVVVSRDAICPFDIDLVFEKVLEYLPTSELWKCQLVSHGWNEKVLELGFPKRRIEVMVHKGNVRHLLEPEISSPFFFSRVLFHLEDVEEDDCTSFFSKYGEYIKSLQLYAEYVDDTRLVQYVTNLRTVFQNMDQVLDLNIISLMDQPFPFTSEELETFRSPNVRKLELQSYSCSPEFSEGLFSVLRNVKVLQLGYSEQCKQFEDGLQKMQLTSLILHGNNISQRSLWRSLETQNLRILNVDLGFYSNEDVASFEQFIQSQSRTLETFIVRCVLLKPEEGTLLRKAQLPILSHLETLQFGSSNFPFDVITPSKLPKLRSTTFDFKRSERVLNGNFTTVQEIRNSGKFWSWETANWRNLASRFPNVSKLSVKLHKGTAGNEPSGFFLSFPNLHFLDLSIYVEDDRDTYVNLLISGFTAEGVRIMSEWLSTTDSPAGLLQVKPSNDSLRNLKKLKELRLDLDAGSEKFKLSIINNVGVQLGLMSIKPLDKLSIFGKFSISEDGASLLKNYHRIAVISPPR